MATPTLYVLELNDGNYYVGTTMNFQNRLQAHAMQRGDGAEWTRLHEFVSVVEKRPIRDAYDETNTTKEYMKKFGIDKVRGGAFVQPVLPDPVRYTLERELRTAGDACFKCGDHGHYAKACTAPTLDILKEYTKSKYSPECCSRCNRLGHTLESCFAYVSAGGRYLGPPKRDSRAEWSSDDDESEDESEDDDESDMESEDDDDESDMDSDESEDDDESDMESEDDD